jgi:lipopolysaccharide/colanic/teichoic acid biosynthesis glycosyltransferase
VEPVVAGAALLFLAPVTVTIAIAIAILSRRSPLVSHKRVGWRGAPLPVVKFRTMWKDKEPSRGALVIEDVSGSVPTCKRAGDPRVTSRFAAFCRRFSLDELPQLYHVARGEMSFVGPRPITRTELETHYGDRADEVVSLRPGLTGLWQIGGRSHLSYEERKRLDLLLVREFSPALYFSILLRSIPRVLTGRDAY